MKDFADYEARKSEILRAYDVVLSADILPIDETGPTQVRERKQNLESDRFLLAVAGRIKSGKSTLLNALLFRSMVLPTDDTPHTAKNTLVEYGEHPSLEITFYNTQEWNALMGEMAGDSRTAKTFAADLEAAGNKGMFKDEWVRPSAVILRKESIADLHTYITPVDKGGLYTPFVKEVKITYPHPWLRSVSIVDTPGVDDPYKFREDMTKKHVTQAGAVLFVTYAGQAMAQPDFDFLNNYLLHVASDRRVIAVNKADTLRGGTAEVDAYLKSLQNHPEPSIRNVFGSIGSIAIVSALGGLIAEMVASGEDLPGSLGDFHRPKLEKAGFLAPEKNGIDALRLKVEERLVNLEGKDILKDHSSFLKAVLERKRRQTKIERSGCEGRLSDLGKTQDELQAQIRDLEEQLKAIENMKLDQRRRIEREAETFFSDFHSEFSELAIRILERTRQELEKEALVGTMGQKAAWHFSIIFEAETKQMTNSLDKCLLRVETLIGDFASKARGLWSKWESAAILDSVMDYSTYKAVVELRATTMNMSSSSSLEGVSRENTGWFQRWFNTEGGRKKSCAAILDDLRTQFQPTITNKAEEVVVEMKRELGKHLDFVALKLSEVQKGRMKDKERLLSGNADREKEKAAILHELEAVEAHQVVLADLERIVTNVSITSA